jgi:hypothetical protein
MAEGAGDFAGGLGSLLILSNSTLRVIVFLSTHRLTSNARFEADMRLRQE